MRNHHKVKHLETEVAQNSHKMTQSALEFFAQTFDWKPGERGKALMLIEIIGGEGGIRTSDTQWAHLIERQVHPVTVPPTVRVLVPTHANRKQARGL